ncbi:MULTISPECIES: sugar ABC transporter substrate-binding protein [unclassified Nocardioides]|uniref:ABC transporter substrate-binding protein n=1 Tax=unclassified Nocardioides TaxID=2615069 RepID=UPI0000570A61|nr:MULTISPECIES: sugar ABC transporter substrate-binding protein [unclassified Nocardioides]ABL84127.1 carbohydrate ABC transporter substrate-binding protein, CUT1 family [Nocardioides sp. JS614]
MKNNRRRLTAIAVAGVASLALGACSQGSATSKDDGADGQTTITYMEFSSNGGHEKDLAAIVDAFEADHPDIKVEVETTPYDAYFTKLQTALAGGTAGDAFELNYENFVTYAENGSLAQLGSFDEAAYKPSLLDAFAQDGAQYALPESFSDVVLFYNKELFDKAGLETPTSDWTWADERAAAEKLTDKDAGIWGDYQPVQFFEFYKALAQSGGSFFSEDGSEATFDSPEGIEAAEWLVSKPGRTMPTEAEGAGTPDFDTNLFKDGKLAMWHSGIWMFAGLADVPFEWDIAVEPGNTQQASAMFANGVAVNAASENKAAAEEWLSYLTSSEVTADTRLSTSWELPPVADESLLAPYLDQDKPANRAAVMESLESVALPPVIARQAEMQDAITQELGEAAAGRKSVKDALADAKKAVDALLG